MKKIVTTSLIAVAALGLAACQPNAADNSAAAANEIALTNDEAALDTNEVAADETVTNETIVDGNEASNVVEAGNVTTN